MANLKSRTSTENVTNHPMNQIELAREIATKAHAGQFRRDGVTPYITHPEAVASRVSDAAKPVAWLHDVLEDCPEWSAPKLERSGIDARTVHAVCMLTKRSDDYFEYIQRVMLNATAREVKIADIEHNLASAPRPKNVTKYKLALIWLKSDIVP